MTPKALQRLFVAVTAVACAAVLYAQNPVSISRLGSNASGATVTTTLPVSGTVAATESGTWTVQPGNTANTTAWKVDGSAVTQPVSGTVTANAGSGTFGVNQTQWAGTAVDVNSGTKSAGTLRVVLATDQPALTNKLLVTPDSVALPANQSVNVSQINAVTPLMGNGVTGTGSPRVTIASDNTAFTVNAAESGTWTVQPGNTANTTAWLIKRNDGTNSELVKACESIEPTTVAISQTANTKIITQTSAKTNYLCGVLLVGADAENLSLVEGTGSTCGTGTAAVIGGTTAANGTNLAANGGWVVPFQIKGTGTNLDLCLFQSGSGRVAGVLTYVQR